MVTPSNPVVYLLEKPEYLSRFFPMGIWIALDDLHVCLAWVASSHLPVIGRMGFDLT
jgi:hypothetical protein